MSLSELVAFLIEQPLLLLTVCVIFLASMGWLLQRQNPVAAARLRIAGYTGMIAAALLTVVQATWQSTRSDIMLATGRVGKVQVRGTQTVIPLDPGGHYWVQAAINGIDQDMMIDTGATYTSISARAARATGVIADASRMPIQLETANGTIIARFAKVDELRFGTIIAQQLDVVITPDSAGDTNVIGMNLLLQIGSWRFENKQLILVPVT